MSRIRTLLAAAACLALTACATAAGLAHGWSLREAHCYPSGTVDCDNYPAKACPCNEVRK